MKLNLMAFEVPWFDFQNDVKLEHLLLIILLIPQSFIEFLPGLRYYSNSIY